MSTGPSPPSLVSGHPLAEVLERLYGRIPLGMRLGLGPMREACARAGQPELTFAAVHVAGTNGKGSVCAMVESVARRSGAKTGLYTSPNLCRFAERIQIAGEPLDDLALARHVTAALDAGPFLSFFEAATLAAFLAFREAAVDLAVIEVGIGGRLDATNVIPPPRAAAITRIALDHSNLLGGTLVEIAREKAGIAKPGVDLVIGPASPEVRAAIDEVAHASGATTSGIDAVPPPPRIGLAGRHQEANARIATVLASRLGIASRAIEDGIAHVRWPGRLESVRARSRRGDERSFLLDAAHNADGAEALAAHLRACAPPPDDVTLVFGALADKDWPAMLDVLAPLATTRIYVSPAGAARASADPHMMSARYPGTVADTIEAAVVLASEAPGARPGSTTAPAIPVGRKAAPLVVVAGSLILIGRVRGLLLGLPCDRPVGL